MYYLGIDWATEKHDLCLLDEDGTITAALAVPSLTRQTRICWHTCCASKTPTADRSPAPAHLCCICANWRGHWTKRLLTAPTWEPFELSALPVLPGCQPVVCACGESHLPRILGSLPNARTGTSADKAQIEVVPEAQQLPFHGSPRPDLCAVADPHAQRCREFGLCCSGPNPHPVAA